MRAAWCALAVLAFGSLIQAETGDRREALSYSSASIVNAASNQPGLAPNTFATIYGTGLAYATRALSNDDIHGDILPTTLPGTGLRVVVNGIPANIWYVSPTQVNILIPASLSPGRAEIQLILDAQAGPTVTVTLAPLAPAIFQLDAKFVIATHLDGSPVTEDDPASPGEFVVFYATGLGPTQPRADYGKIPHQAAQIEQLPDFSVTFDGTRLDSSRIYYAGLTPDFAGLFQVNVRLPDDVADNPEVRMGVGDRISPPDLRLPLRRKP